jgi:uncharacterized protein (TIGR03435 family)
MMRYWSIPMLLAAAAYAQPAFEVASIRPTRLVSGVEGGNWPKVVVSPSSVTLHKHTLRDCIAWGWSVRAFQISGPALIDDEKYEIGARTAAPATPGELRLMLRNLLEERFKLGLHRESKDVPVYALAPARKGPKLHPAASEESGWSKLPGGGLRLSFRRSTVAQLAEFLSTLIFVDRPVVDASGLAAAYDFTLDLREVADSADAARPSLGTLLEEQLGLKLEARKAPFTVLVVDRVELPTAN